MKVSNERIRRAVLWSASGALTAAMIVAGTSAQAAHPTRQADRTAQASGGPGYPPPKGIYKPFTDCPILNPLMAESLPNQVTGCIAGVVTGGKIKIGNITTKVRATAKVKVPVEVQFGIWDPPNAGDNQFTGGVLPPPDGLPAQLTSFPQHIPGGLNGALGCPSTNKTVQKLCSEIPDSAKNKPLYASAESAGPVMTRFPSSGLSSPGGRTRNFAVRCAVVSKAVRRPTCRTRNCPAGTVCSPRPGGPPRVHAPRCTTYMATRS